MVGDFLTDDDAGARWGSEARTRSVDHTRIGVRAERREEALGQRARCARAGELPDEHHRGMRVRSALLSSIWWPSKRFVPNAGWPYRAMLEKLERYYEGERSYTAILRRSSSSDTVRTAHKRLHRLLSRIPNSGRLRRHLPPAICRNSTRSTMSVNKLGELLRRS